MLYDRWHETQAPILEGSFLEGRGVKPRFGGACIRAVALASRGP